MSRMAARAVVATLASSPGRALTWSCAAALYICESGTYMNVSGAWPGDADSRIAGDADDLELATVFALPGFESQPERDRAHRRALAPSFRLMIATPGASRPVSVGEIAPALERDLHGAEEVRRHAVHAPIDRRGRRCRIAVQCAQWTECGPATDGKLRRPGDCLDARDGGDSLAHLLPGTPCPPHATCHSARGRST